MRHRRMGASDDLHRGVLRLIGVGSTARHAERIKNLDIKNLDVLDSTVRWS